MESKNIRNRAEQLLSLEGKVAIVTGGASGIGRGISVLLGEMGASVAILDRNVEGAMEVASTIQKSEGKATAIQCDVRLHADCQQAVEQTVATYGRVDIRCNNAGIVIRKDVVALDEEEWDAVLDVTLKKRLPALTRSDS